MKDRQARAIIGLSAGAAFMATTLLSTPAAAIAIRADTDVGMYNAIAQLSQFQSAAYLRFYTTTSKPGWEQFDHARHMWRHAHQPHQDPHGRSLLRERHNWRCGIANAAGRRLRDHDPRFQSIGIEQLHGGLQPAIRHRGYQGPGGQRHRDRHPEHAGNERDAGPALHRQRVERDVRDGGLWRPEHRHHDRWHPRCQQPARRLQHYRHLQHERHPVRLRQP